MNGAFEVGAVTLRANQRALEAMANNIANMNTPTFKRADVIYAEVAGDPPQTLTNAASLASAREALPGGVRIAERQMISAQVELRPTNNALDIALGVRGFVQLMAGPAQSA